MNMQKETEAVTPEATIVYPDVFQPSSFKDGPEMYRCVLLIPETADLSEVKAAIKVARERKFPGQSAEFYKQLRYPIRRGEEKARTEEGYIDEGSFYFGNWFITPKSKFQPEIVDIYGKPITDQKAIYGGCKVRALLTFYGYEYLGNKGVGVTLRAVCKIADGDPIGGSKVDVKTAFGDYFKASDETWQSMPKQSFLSENDITY
jgi:hypothetical protein